MKILYVITSTDVGGAEKFLTELIKVTAKEHIVEVISLNKCGPLAAKMKENGARQVWSCDMVHPYKFGVLRELSRIINRFEPDIIHAFLYRAIQFCRLVCAGKKYKLICSPHFDMAKRNILLRGMDRFLSHTDNLCVAESFYTARYLVEKQGYRKDKVYFLPNGIDIAKFSPSPAIREKMRKNQEISKKEIVFVCIARLAAVKDPLTLLKAFLSVYNKNRRIRLFFVGEGTMRPEMENFIKENKLEKAVFLVGHQEQVSDYLNMADVFVLPSIEESLPLALLEAVSVGLPCIVSNAGDMNLWVEHGKNGFVFKKKDDILLSCLLAELATNKQLRETMAQNSLKKAKEITDPFTGYQQIYKQI